MSDYISKLREKIGTEKILIPSNACIILNEQDEILLQQRTNKTWGCPGGLMDIGETVIEALKREVFEETNLKIINPQLFGIYSGENYEAKYSDGNETASVLMVFFVREFSGELRSDRESLQLKFFKTDILPGNLNKYHTQYLSDFKKWLLKEIEIPVML